MCYECEDDKEEIELMIEKYCSATRLIVLIATAHIGSTDKFFWKNFLKSPGKQQW